MNLDRRHLHFGYTLREKIESAVFTMRDEFNDITFLSGGLRENFELSDEEAVEIIRRCIHAMLDAGGVVMDRTKNMDYPLFLPTDRFGTTRDEITEAVIAEWLSRGGFDGKFDWAEYAFAFPDDHP